MAILVAADLLKEMLARFSKIPLELRARPKDFTRPKSSLSGERLGSEFKATEPQGLLKRVSALINRH